MFKIIVVFITTLFARFYAKKYHTAGTFPKSNVKIDERGKIDTLTHTKMTVHFPGLVHALQ
jgi:hypothetical protein